MLPCCLQETAMPRLNVDPSGISPCMFPLAEVRYELSFWLNNIDSFIYKVMSPKSSAVGVVYSDASDSGLGGYFVQCGLDLVSVQLVPRRNAN